jgi:hypothetical protein
MRIEILKLHLTGLNDLKFGVYNRGAGFVVIYLYLFYHQIFYYINYHSFISLNQPICEIYSLIILTFL